MLSQEQLKALLHYDPDTGLFTWLATRGPAVAGALAGCLSPNRYIMIRVNWRLYRAHRLAWLYAYGSFPPTNIDHVNMVRHDNRLINLRAAINQENGRRVT